MSELAPAPVSASEDKKLSNKELKELKKKEKAAKRAAAKGGSSGAEAASTKQKESKDSNGKPPTATHIKKQLHSAKIIESERKVPTMFGHLETREQRISSSPQIASIVHPRIIALTLKISTYKIVGSTARCQAMLEAFKDVILSYQTPNNASLQRNLTSHLSHQIEYLKTGRPLSISMGNAIRWLKQRISIIPIDLSDESAKKQVIEEIDLYIQEKILYSDRVITQFASTHIQDGSKLLTYGHSEVLKKLFKYCAVEENKSFDIYIIDSKPLFEGKKLARELSAVPNIKCHYNLINSLSTILERSDIDFCFLGAHSMLSNGRLYSRVGTAMIAMASKNKNIPVLVCCESMKFSDKVQLDSVTLNELGDSEDVINTKPFVKTGSNLNQFLISLENKEPKKSQQQGTKKDKKELQIAESEPHVLNNWKELNPLNILNVLYDLTPPEYIQKVITELGALPPSSVPVILREYKTNA
ncbi:hypothetical protein KL930_005299 [Ogataea haglerorum]|uniref:Translation initiation factor eIF2B subunit delta n=1 Tax=Ogataea haglerorum TaxID=1937702 RepID=A0AAN6D0J2_9ASCO|nr:hypothetical protein KL915_005297 [Ogataea haglerorum]KAG7702217.1 hypothetical protein KL914_005348 [Ogataea haglerorum]KAG7702265.1 hypothetical protein KL950_005315 [Ogataea haglerorum]KAG7723832.1 hypothetical protein KL933_005307 [Ogataea haglerorum]KAG7724444.1 hypothetical protein KL948_005287 [Ogataea haglerorum]